MARMVVAAGAHPGYEGGTASPQVEGVAQQPTGATSTATPARARERGGGATGHVCRKISPTASLPNIEVTILRKTTTGKTWRSLDVART